MKHSQMQIEDCFWSPIISKMCNDIIPYQYEVLNDEIEGIPRSHAIENFRIASGQKKGKYVGMLFQDSDVAKWIEAAAYSLKVNNNAEIREKIESVIDLIEQTQQEDGYLDTYYICEKPDQKLKILHMDMKCIVQDIYWKQRLDMRRLLGKNVSCILWSDI